jgi:hypothetical protein
VLMRVFNFLNNEIESSRKFSRSSSVFTISIIESSRVTDFVPFNIFFMRFRIVIVIVRNVAVRTVKMPRIRMSLPSKTILEKSKLKLIFKKYTITALFCIVCLCLKCLIKIRGGSLVGFAKNLV